MCCVAPCLGVGLMGFVTPGFKGQCCVAPGVWGGVMCCIAPGLGGVIEVVSLGDYPSYLFIYLTQQETRRARYHLQPRPHQTGRHNTDRQTDRRTETYRKADRETGSLLGKWLQCRGWEA